jgi:hypothetical protein
VHLQVPHATYADVCYAEDARMLLTYATYADVCLACGGADVQLQVPPVTGAAEDARLSSPQSRLAPSGAYVRQHTSAYVSIRQQSSPQSRLAPSGAYVRQHTSAYVSIRQQSSPQSRLAPSGAYVRQHTSAYVSIRQHTRAEKAAESPRT